MELLYIHPSSLPSFLPAGTCVIRSVSWICRHRAPSSASLTREPASQLASGRTNAAPTFSFKGWPLGFKEPQGPGFVGLSCRCVCQGRCTKPRDSKSVALRKPYQLTKARQGKAPAAEAWLGLARPSK